MIAPAILPWPIRSVWGHLVVVGMVLVAMPSFSGVSVAAPVEVLGNEGVVRRLFDELLTQGNLATADEIYSRSVAIHTPDGEFQGHAGVGERVAMLRITFPGATFTIDALDLDRDFISVAWTMRAPRSGPYRGVSASGVPITLRGLAVVRLDRYLIVEEWSDYIQPGLLHQLARPGE